LSSVSNPLQKRNRKWQCAVTLYFVSTVQHFIKNQVGTNSIKKTEFITWTSGLFHDKLSQ